MLRGAIAARRARAIAALRDRSLERRIGGGWLVSLVLSPRNWTVGFWIDAPPSVHIWFGPLGLGLAKAAPDDGRSWDLAWTLARVTIGRTEFQLDADLNIHQFGVAFARGLRDAGLYLGPALNVQVEHDVLWRDPRPNPLIRLFVPQDAPRWSILRRRERAAVLDEANAGRLDLVRFAPRDTGLDRPLWVGRGAEVVVVPRRQGDRAAVGRDCSAVGLDQDTGYRDADRWLGANAYLLRKLSVGRLDTAEFLAASRRVEGKGFARTP